jgi:hypothetical protein
MNLPSISDYLGLTIAVLLLMGVLGLLLNLMVKIKTSQFDFELKRVQLGVIRKSLEQKGYQVNEQLMADPTRWLDVNHLLVEGQKVQSNVASNSPQGSQKFLANLGITAPTPLDARKVFTLTPFHPRYNHVYQVIKTTCEKIGLICERGDEENVPGAVLPHIVRKLTEASTVIANIDGRNPNVYYELGIAQALGKETILVASDLRTVPFDIQAQRIIFYKDAEDLERSLLVVLARQAMAGASKPTGQDSRAFTSPSYPSSPPPG